MPDLEASADGVFRVRSDWYNYSYPDGAFKHLISLEKLSLDVALDFTFKPGFRNLRKLNYLEATSYDCDNVFRYFIKGAVISNQTFYYFEDIPIRSLVLRGCHYKAIHSGSFAMLKNLTNLNLACTTELNFTDVISAIQGMPSDTIETLIFDGMKMESVMNWCHKNFNNVKRLSIRGTASAMWVNEIKIGNENQCLASLEHLNMGANYPPY